MNEIVTNTANLPANIEDLSKFVLVGREKLTAVRAEIRAIQKVGLAKEVHEQKLREAQDIADAVLDAEVRIGELTRKMSKATNQYALPNGGKSKTEQLSEIGLKHPERFESLAAHPEAVEKAKAEAREEGRIVTRQDAINNIVSSITKSPKKLMQEYMDSIQKEHIQPDLILFTGDMLNRGGSSFAGDIRAGFEEFKYLLKCVAYFNMIEGYEIQ